MRFTSGSTESFLSSPEITNSWHQENWGEKKSEIKQEKYAYFIVSKFVPKCSPKPDLANGQDPCGGIMIPFKKQMSVQHHKIKFFPDMLYLVGKSFINDLTSSSLSLFNKCSFKMIIGIHSYIVFIRSSIKIVQQ